MANLTNRQRNLLQLVNQFSQNLISDMNTTSNDDDDNSLNSNFSFDLPGVDVNAGIDVDFNNNDDNDDRPGNGDGPGPGTPPPSTPTTLREVLLSLRNQQVEVTTPFGPVTGTLIAVRNDYIVLIEADDDGDGDDNDVSQVLVPIESIELVSDL